MMESVASSLLRTRRAGEGVCDCAGVNFGTRKRPNTKMATMDFLIVVVSFMVGSPRRQSDARGYCKGILALRGRVDGEKLKSRKMPGSRQAPPGAGSQQSTGQDPGVSSRSNGFWYSNKGMPKKSEIFPERR